MVGQQEPPWKTPNSQPPMFSRSRAPKAAQPNASARDRERETRQSSTLRDGGRERERKERAESKGSEAGSLGGGLRRWAKGEKEERRGRGTDKREGDQREMASEETAGGARKATKSKLFEFLVHGVVRTLSARVCVCVCVCVCVFELSYRHSPCAWLIAVNSVHVKVISSPPAPRRSSFWSGDGVGRRGEWGRRACKKKRARRIGERERKAKGSTLVTGGCMRLAACLRWRALSFKTQAALWLNTMLLQLQEHVKRFG